MLLLKIFSKKPIQSLNKHFIFLFPLPKVEPRIYLQQYLETALT